MGQALNILMSVSLLTRISETDSQQLPSTYPDTGFQINTSALRRAFPDFSQTGSSEEESIELGRGLKDNNGPLSEDTTEPLPFSFGNGTNYRLMATPPVRPRKTMSRSNLAKAAAQTTDDKENDDPIKETKTGSGSSGKGSIDSRRTLVDKHATVESDDSVVVHEAKPRSTRFADARGKGSTATVPTNQPLEQIYQNGSVNGTYQSFALPDLPNITELVSGGRTDGTPLFNRSVKRSRFNTPSQARHVSSAKPIHAAVSAVPIPAEVNALYVSLQLLQEKVTSLENDKERSEQQAQDLEMELLQMKSRVETYERAQPVLSGLPAATEDSRTLQQRLEKANRKINKSEAKVSALSRDCNSLRQQLGLPAKIDDQDETMTLKDEVLRLRNQMSQLKVEQQRSIDRMTTSEAELRGKIQRREKAINQMASLAKELWDTRKALSIFEEDGDFTQAFTFTKAPRINSTKRNLSNLSYRRISTDMGSAGNAEMDAGVSDAESTTHIRETTQKRDISKCSSFMSFMEGDEVGKLRQVVLEDKAKLAELKGLTEDFNGIDLTIQSNAAQRKPPTKKVTYGDVTLHNLEQPTGTTDAKTEQHTQQTNMSQASERRRRNMRDANDLTSGFIIPDITLRGKPAPNVNVSSPVPVSDRVIDEADATLRPAQDPVTALAVVLKGMENGLIPLREQLSAQQVLYNQHDPALSKRKRTAVFERIQQLLSAIEQRADQIYALYDVLEGQKAQGQLANQNDAADVTEELPAWEGLETTGTI